jgi:rare lipoprotein A
MQWSLILMRAAAVAMLLAGLSGCGRKASRPATPNAPKTVRKGWSQEGIASWYGVPYHGRKTASGEVYDMYQMTAAHKTLPFGVVVEVRNKTNARKVEVRVTDRGPFVKGRIIDLSRAAAEAIELIGPGTAPVKIKVIRTQAK